MDAAADASFYCPVGSKLCFGNRLRAATPTFATPHSTAHSVIFPENELKAIICCTVWPNLPSISENAGLQTCKMMDPGWLRKQNLRGLRMWRRRFGVCREFCCSVLCGCECVHMISAAQTVLWRKVVRVRASWHQPRRFTNMCVLFASWALVRVPPALGFFVSDYLMPDKHMCATPGARNRWWSALPPRKRMFRFVYNFWRSDFFYNRLNENNHIICICIPPSHTPAITLLFRKHSVVLINLSTDLLTLEILKTSTFLHLSLSFIVAKICCWRFFNRSIQIFCLFIVPIFF